MKYILAESSFPCPVRFVCSSPSCRRLAANFFGLCRSKAKPYCSKHITHMRKQLRELNRLDDLLNKILLLNVKWLSHFRTLSSTPLANGSLVVHQNTFDRPRALYSNPVEPVHVWVKEMAWCYNSCMHALETLAGVLAYLTEGSLRIEEVDLHGVHATQRALFLTHTIDGSVRAASLANIHSMFKVTTPLGDVFLDPTAPQYGRRQGWQECDEYLKAYHKVPRQLSHLLGPRHRAFGSAYAEHRKKLEVSPVDPTYDPLFCVAEQAATRNINNFVYAYVEAAGGPGVLRTGTDIEWADLEETIVYRVGDWMETLRADIDQLVYGIRRADRRSDAYWTMLHESDGQGHRRIVESLSRAYGATLSP